MSDSGDGTFSKDKRGHYKIRFSIGYYEKEYAQILENKMLTWFNKKPHKYYSYFKGNLSAIILSYNSKIIYELIQKYLYWEGKKTYSIKLKELNLNNHDFNKGYLRGLIDTDGSYYAPKRRLSYSTVSKQLADQVIIIIEKILIKPKVYIIKKPGNADLYTISLHGVNSKKLIQIINPTNPNKNPFKDKIKYKI